MARVRDDARRLWHALVHPELSTRRLPSGSCGQTAAFILAPAAGLLAPAHSPNILAAFTERGFGLLWFWGTVTNSLSRFLHSGQVSGAA